MTGGAVRGLVVSGAEVTGAVVIGRGVGGLVVSGAAVTGTVVIGGGGAAPTPQTSARYCAAAFGQEEVGYSFVCDQALK